MTVRTYLEILRRYLLWIVLLLIIGGSIGFGYSHTLPRLYRSYASVIVVPVRSDNTTEVVQGSNYVANIVPSYSKLATTPYVLQPVIDNLGLNETTTQLARKVDVQILVNTVIIQISVTDESPVRAQQIAEAINESLVSAVEELSPTIGNTPAVELETISPASLPSNFVSPDWRLFTLGGALIGLVLAIALGLLREQLRSHPRNVDDLAALPDVAVLGDVPEVSRGTGSSLPASMLAQADGPMAEAIRGIVASLRFVSVGKTAKVFLVTSANSSDGKTSFAAALALALAETGNRTLLIDADLRNPSVAELLGLEGAVGLTTVLLKEATFSDAIQSWGHESLEILVGGDRAPNPGQLVSSTMLTDVISKARARFDTVIIDTPPVLPVSDALWIGPASDGAIVVVRARKTPIRDVMAALTSLATAQVPVLGTVLNRAKESHRKSYYGAHERRALPKRLIHRRTR